MIGKLLSFVIEVVLIMGLGTVTFNHFYHDMKSETLQEVAKGPDSLKEYTEKMTGKKSWVETPAPKKNILHGIGNW